MVGLSDPKCWLGDPGTCFWVTRKNISNTGADQLCRSSWSCCGKFKPLKRPQFRQKISANFGAWQVPWLIPIEVCCVQQPYMPCANFAECFWKWGYHGIPSMVIFRGNTVIFSMELLFFAEKALSLMIVIVTVMASSQNSDHYHTFLILEIMSMLVNWWRLAAKWAIWKKFESLLSICNVLTRSG